MSVSYRRPPDCCLWCLLLFFLLFDRLYPFCNFHMHILLFLFSSADHAVHLVPLVLNSLVFLQALFDHQGGKE